MIRLSTIEIVIAKPKTVTYRKSRFPTNERYPRRLSTVDLIRFITIRSRREGDSQNPYSKWVAEVVTRRDLWRNNGWVVSVN